jgi:Plavaka transposase
MGHRQVGAAYEHDSDQRETFNTPTSYHPYPNWSSYALGDWFWNRGVVNSKERFGELLEVLRHPEFKKEDVCTTSWDAVDQALSDGIKPIGPDSTSPDKFQIVDDLSSGWDSTDVVLDIPLPNRGQGAKVERFTAGALHYRSIVSVIREKMTDPQEFRRRHLQPFELLWQPDLRKDPVPVYGDLYFSNEFRRINTKVQNMAISDPSHTGLERVVIALMFWSDSTLLADFGSASLWPCYLFFGNDSKDQRGKPSANLCNHVAYFESVFALQYVFALLSSLISLPVTRQLQGLVPHQEWRSNPLQRAYFSP